MRSFKTLEMFEYLTLSQDKHGNINAYSMYSMGILYSHETKRSLRYSLFCGYPSLSCQHFSLDKKVWIKKYWTYIVLDIQRF